MGKKGPKQEGKMPVFIDTIPNLLKLAGAGKKGKEKVADLLRQEFESQIDDIISKYASLPWLMIHPGEYCDLLTEARTLFVSGYFYSCVAMCGITAERIVKDIFSRSLLVILNGQPMRPSDRAIEDLESFGAKDICDFLIDAGVLNVELRSPFKGLGELRNKYTHAGGKRPEKDARTAINHLHKIIDGTVSILKDFDIQEGKLVKKSKR